MSSANTSSTSSSCSASEATSPVTVVASREISHADLQAMKACSDTVKKNPKSEFSQADLLRLLSYLEGELQAREVVIAALRSENIKQHIFAARGIIIGSHDPQAALFRDSLATTGNLVSRPSSALAAQSEHAVRQFARQKLDALQNVIYEQRHAHTKLIGVLKDFEDKHKTLLQQLAEEKQKHERDTAQGDDITYGLEVERTRLRVDLETERAQTKRLEKEAKKSQETLEAERARQKTIVLLLLAERKRIIMKYMEERKRSEDLAQILSEEKLRVDSISEGLEEESKKSLRMEADMETQQQTFELERKRFAATLAGSELKIREHEQELAQMRLELLRKQHQYDAVVAQQRMQLPQKGMAVRASHDGSDESGGAVSATAASPLMSSVTKVVQPTATVSSVPVSGPTTGIARSISPGQTMRPVGSSGGPAGDLGGPFNAVKVAPRKLSNVAAPPPPLPQSSQAAAAGASIGPAGVAIATHHTQVTQQAQHAGKLNAGHMISTIKKTPAALPLGRGVPPPIPPNKPVVPPKREPSVTRMGSVTQTPQQQHLAAVNAAVAAAAASVNAVLTSSSSSSPSSLSSSSAAAAAAASGTAPASPMATGVAVATSGTTEDII